MIKGHGDDIYAYKDIRINFSSNVYNHFNHEGLYKYLSDNLLYIENYPEPSAESLEKILMHYDGLKDGQVIVTNGATEAIYLIAQTFRGAYSNVITPTFSEYSDACRIHGHKIHFVYESNLNQLDELNKSKQIETNGTTTLTWLCNPNNPTGQVIPKSQLLSWITSNPEMIFVIDASYAKYTNEQLFSAKEAAEFPNVLMLHSMTKDFAIPGLRLGYITGDSTLLSTIRLQRMPWSVNQLAIKAGGYLLKHELEYVLPVEDLLKEKDYLTKELKSLGVIDVWPSDTHILLCRLRIGRASALKDYLAENYGILIRDASNFEGLDCGYFRIAVQSAEENDELLKRIEEWISL